MKTTPDIAPQRGMLLAIIMVSYLMIVIDISIVITGLPHIQASLGFTPAGLSWVQNAYTLAFGGLLLLGARAGDILGRRRMFICGLGLFTLASLAIALAQTPGWLLSFRAIQGVGAAILAPSTLALLSTHFAEGPQRTRALALYAAAAGMGATIGLVLGGLFADLVSWRAGFFINVPIGLVLILGTRRHIPETSRHAGRLDLPGALTSTLGMGALVFGIVYSADAGWGDPLTLSALGLGLVLLLVFVAVEQHARQPILPLRLLAHRERSGAYAARMLFLGGMVGFWFFSTQYLQAVLGFSALGAGLAYLPTTLSNLAAAMGVPRLAQRFGNARLLCAGLFMAILGLLWLAQATAYTPYLTGVALPMLLIGFGQGFVLAPLTVAGVSGVAHDDAGAASGLVNVAHQLGGSLGLGLLVVVFSAAHSAGGATEQLAHRIASTLDASALMLALALIITITCILPRPVYTRAVVAPGGAGQ